MTVQVCPECDIPDCRHIRAARRALVNGSGAVTEDKISFQPSIAKAEQMRAALLAIMAAHKFNSTDMLPIDVYRMCSKALEDSFEQPGSKWATGLFVSSSDPRKLVRMVATGEAKIAEMQAHKDFIRWEHMHG